jgi:hypothetical protein
VRGELCVGGGRRVLCLTACVHVFFRYIAVGLTDASFPLNKQPVRVQSNSPLLCLYLEHLGRPTDALFLNQYVARVG